MNQHNSFLRRTLELAQKADSRVYPNPRVGAVIVHENRIIGEGLHEYAGGPHAEVNAVASVQDKSLLAHSTLYVSLEPCNHFGKTPPCTQLILANQIPKVVVGCLDPNPQVAGSGVAFLRSEGVEVEVADENQDFERLNKVFFVNQLQKRPYIVLKWAETADGYIAPLPQAPLAITGKQANRLTHSLRAYHHAILVGKNTANIDNPTLSTRYFYGRNPLRMVLAGKPDFAPGLKLLQDDQPCLILNSERAERLGNKTFLRFAPAVLDDPKSLMTALYQQYQICSILVEGGTQTLKRFLEAGLHDEVYRFVSPKPIGRGYLAPQIGKLPLAKTFLGEDALWHY